MRIVFRAPNWLGDAVLATVVPPPLRRAHRDVTVDVLAPSSIASVYAGLPGVDAVVAFEPGDEVDAYRRGRYDLAVLAPTSFGSAWRSFLGCPGTRRVGYATSGRGVLLARSLPGRESRRDRHQVENYRALAALGGGRPGPEDVPRVAVDGASRGAAEALWGGAARPRVVLQPGATYGPAKRWPADRFAAVARGLADRGVHVAVAGGPGDAQAVDAVRERAPFVMSFLGRTTVPVLAAVLESADAVVTNDTGPMHLAAAVGTRTVAVFGSTSPEWTGPLGRGHGVVREPVPCAPCFRRDCRIGYLCFLGVSAERVLAEVLRTLEGETG